MDSIVLSNSNGYGGSNNNNTISYAEPTKYNNEKTRATAQEIKYSVSRYYSPVPNQRRYYNNKSYESDVTMNCWKSAINNNWCLYTANGTKLDNNMILSVASCPREYLWKTLDIWWHTLRCIDTWWAIVKKWNIVRVDLWCWIGDYALDNRDKCKL